VSGDLLLGLMAPALAVAIIAAALFSARLPADRRRLVEALTVFGLTPLFAWAVGGAVIDAVAAQDWPALAMNAALLAVVGWVVIRLARRRTGPST